MPSNQQSRKSWKGGEGQEQRPAVAARRRLFTVVAIHACAHVVLGRRVSLGPKFNAHNPPVGAYVGRETRKTRSHRVFRLQCDMCLATSTRVPPLAFQSDRWVWRFFFNE